MNLAGVPNAQNAAVSLSIIDSLGNALPNNYFRLGFLLGDVNRDGIVNAADTAETKSTITTPTPISPINATVDVKLDGKLTIADSAVVKANLNQTVAP